MHTCDFSHSISHYQVINPIYHVGKNEIFDHQGDAMCPLKKHKSLCTMYKVLSVEFSEL